MKITVGICTWNRAKLLDLTLGRMISMRIPEGVTWELLVVNNNSTDDTESVITSYENRLPLRRLFEPSPGLSNARNHAIREAKGGLIIWTDDDVLVDSDWLAAYAAAADRWPDAAFFGGPIEAWFEGEPPAWLRHVSSFVSRDFGKEPCVLTGEKLPVGANMAMRTAVQRHYMFDPELGIRPNSLLCGEETAVFGQMTRDGLEGRWVPDARVKHFTPRERQTMPYLRKYYHGYGLFLARTAEKAETALLFGYPRWLVRKVLQCELKYRMRRLLCAPDVWIDDLVQASTLWGMLEGSRTDRKQGQIRGRHAH
ncbi:MAG: glycosyltransferase [Syntrophobacteraceae bacterium]